MYYWYSNLMSKVIRFFVEATTMSLACTDKFLLVKYEMNTKTCTFIHSKWCREIKNIFCNGDGGFQNDFFIPSTHGKGFKTFFYSAFCTLCTSLQKLA